jgi:hypothetical protein
MIELKVEDYCADCPDFKPEVDKSLWRNDYSLVPTEKAVTAIYCVHRNKCKCLYDYIKKDIGRIKP